MNNEKRSFLAEKAKQIRIDAVKAVYAAKSGHPGGALSVADILAYLYFDEMNVDPKDPKKADRDRFVLSKGHACPALYAALAEKGFFPKDVLLTFRKDGSILQGHPDMKHIPGVDMSTGSLGQGISAACGMALSGKISGEKYRVYAILGDGEIEEGQVWEAAMFASHYKLDNLCIFVDYNPFAAELRDVEGVDHQHDNGQVEEHHHQRQHHDRELAALHAAPPDSLRAVASARRLASRASCRLIIQATHASGTSTDRPITAASAEACGRLRSGNVRW